MESPGSERGKAEKEGQGVSQENTNQKNKNIVRGAWETETRDIPATVKPEVMSHRVRKV